MTYEQTLSPVAITEENALQVALDAGLTLVEVEQSMAKGIALTEIAASAVRLRDQGLLRGLDECQVRLPLTLERIIQALSELKITVRLNLITREMEVLGLPAAFNSPEAPTSFSTTSSSGATAAPRSWWRIFWGWWRGRTGITRCSTTSRASPGTSGIGCWSSSPSWGFMWRTRSPWCL